MSRKTENEIPYVSHTRGLWILSPLLVFFLLYVTTSVAVGDFYKMPVTVAFMAACTWAFIVCRPRRFSERIERFSRGAAHSNIMMMVWIFVLAGAFAQSAKYIGSVDATVNLTLSLLPANMVLAGVFLAACIISLSIGTSVGTIVALMPVAVGLADKAGAPLALMAGGVIGGAFFGDNLSFISDTTIASTRTQGCAMQDKFKANFAIVFPAALLVLALYVYLGWDLAPVTITQETEWLKVLPYLLVLGTALCGMNVMKVLILGIISTGIVASIGEKFTLMDWVSSMGNGMTGMGELIIVTLMAAGMLELIRYNGGLTYIVKHLTACIRGKRGAECSIALMAALANFCTANNTVAIVAVGNIARSVAQKYGISAPRSASLLDTASCVIQGILPYGAQLLMGSALAGLTAFAIIPYLFYPFVMGISALIFIIFGLAEKK
ncbi:MAG: Na+/H+ antiporter NhaC family protein [Akkermansia sp.]|nr:Na+/H+ antiporter NhaC family protein [Akkermansia sp.]